jgi:protein-tyrosine-phosphatase
MTILFVCVQNAARSQMGEFFFRKYAPKGYETVSAGTVQFLLLKSILLQLNLRKRSE